jgi:hypothetical protein
LPGAVNARVHEMSEARQRKKGGVASPPASASKSAAAAGTPSASARSPAAAAAPNSGRSTSGGGRRGGAPPPARREEQEEEEEEEEEGSDAGGDGYGYEASDAEDEEDTENMPDGPAIADEDADYEDGQKVSAGGRQGAHAGAARRSRGMPRTQCPAPRTPGLPARGTARGVPAPPATAGHRVHPQAACARVGARDVAGAARGLRIRQRTQRCPLS